MENFSPEVGVTYVICPDSSCKLFFDRTRACPCDGHCPKKQEQQLVIVCAGCKEMIVLRGGTSLLTRIDHSCPNGNITANFRMSGKYHLLYEIPKIKQ